MLITASLLINIAVLIPVCISLLAGAGWTDAAYGPDTPARGILLSIYAAILIGSVGLLFKPEPSMVAMLLALQIVYKISTPFSVGSWSNPVVISNLAIAAFHCLTVWSIWSRR